MQLLAPLSWPDLIFHVLAHVRGTADLPSSVYDPCYIQQAEQWLGPAAERTLGEDALILGRLAAGDHPRFARLQLLAWLFESVEQARRCADRDLAELGPAEVARPELLGVLIAQGPAVEILRCAAELERPSFGQLPAPAPDLAALGAGLGGAVALAPTLAELAVMPVRALRLRGRVFGREIWVGCPGGPFGPPLAHTVWQACHEATVWEIGRWLTEPAAPDLSEREVEGAAVVLLAERARRADRAAEHAEWLAHLGENAPSTAPAALPPRTRELLVAHLRG